jgi:hypothetical protein
MALGHSGGSASRSRHAFEAHASSGYNVQTTLRRRRRGLARRLSWLAIASLAAMALLATPAFALGQTPTVRGAVGAPQLTIPATDAATGDSQDPLGENWRLIALAVVGAVAVTLRRTTATPTPLNEPTDH